MAKKIKNIKVDSNLDAIVEMVQGTIKNKNKKNKNKGSKMKNTKNTKNIVNTKNEVKPVKEVNLNNIYGNSYNGYNRYGKYGYYGFQKNYKEPTNIKQFDKINYVVMRQDVLNTIMKRCLPKAGGSEFQFHYWALQVKLSAADGRRFAFTFPLAFFNFKQTVSTGSVDFNLIEVDAEAQKVKEPAKELAKMIMKAFPKDLFKNLGFEVKFEFGDVGSIHRHPGRFGFSSIDLRYNPLKPGVIYRNKEGSDLWQTDSVLYCATNAELVTTETRVFNISPVDPNDEDKGSTGTVAEIPTVMIMVGGQEEEEVPVIDFSDFFGAKKASKEIKNYLVKKTMKAQEINEAIEIANALGAVIQPLDFVDENKISQAHTYYGYGRYGNYGTNVTTIGFDTDTDIDIDLNVNVTEVKSTEVKSKYVQPELNLEAISEEKDSPFNDAEMFFEDDERKDIQSNSSYTSSIIIEIMEMLEIPDKNSLDENSLWDLMKDFRQREDLFDMYAYYADQYTERLVIQIDSGRLIMDIKGLKMYIGETLVEEDEWRIG